MITDYTDKLADIDGVKYLARNATLVRMRRNIREALAGGGTPFSFEDYSYMEIWLRNRTNLRVSYLSCLLLGLYVGTEGKRTAVDMTVIS